MDFAPASFLPPKTQPRSTSPTGHRKRRIRNGKNRGLSDNLTLDGVVPDPAGDKGSRVSSWVGLIKDRPELGKLALDEALGAEALLLGWRSYEWLAGAVAIPKWRAGGQVEQRSRVRRVLDPRGSRVEQLDGVRRRGGGRGLDAEAGARRGNRRSRELTARTHVAGARPGRRAAVEGVSGHARRRRAPLRRDQRQEPMASSMPGPSRATWSSSPTRSSGRPRDQGLGGHGEPPPRRGSSGRRRHERARAVFGRLAQGP